MSQTKRKEAEPTRRCKECANDLTCDHDDTMIYPNCFKKKSLTKNGVTEEGDETITERMEREESEREFRELHDTTFSKKASPRKPMWKCPCCKPTLWFGDLHKLREHVRVKHPQINVCFEKNKGKPETKTYFEIDAWIQNLGHDDFIRAQKLRWVSEDDHLKSMKEYGKQNEALAKVCGDLKDEIGVLEGENVKLNGQVGKLNNDLQAVFEVHNATMKRLSKVKQLLQDIEKELARQ